MILLHQQLCYEVHSLHPLLFRSFRNCQVVDEFKWCRISMNFSHKCFSFNLVQSLVEFGGISSETRTFVHLESLDKTEPWCVGAVFFEAGPTWYVRWVSSHKNDVFLILFGSFECFQHLQVYGIHCPPGEVHRSTCTQKCPMIHAWSRGWKSAIYSTTCYHRHPEVVQTYEYLKMNPSKKSVQMLD